MSVDFTIATSAPGLGLVSVFNLPCSFSSASSFVGPALGSLVPRVDQQAVALELDAQLLSFLASRNVFPI